VKGEVSYIFELEWVWSFDGVVTNSCFEWNVGSSLSFTNSSAACSSSQRLSWGSAATETKRTRGKHCLLAFGNLEGYTAIAAHFD
jgi:hypothetical protein